MGITYGPRYDSFNSSPLFITGDLLFIVNTQLVTPGATSFSLITSGTCTYDIDWGDNSRERVNASGTFTITHTYSNAGIYSVNVSVVSGTFRPYYAGNAAADIITTVRGKNTYSSPSISLDNAFNGANNIQEFSVNSNLVTNLSYAFYGATSLRYFGSNAASTAIKVPLFNCANFSSCTNIIAAFINTGQLQFNGVNLSGLSGNQFFDIFRGEQGGVFGGFNVTRSSVVSIGSSSQPIVFGTTGGNTFGLQQFASYCTSLRDVYFDSGVKITNLITSFTGCTSLGTFEVLDKNLSNCTDFTSAFNGCTSLSTFNGFNLSNCTNFTTAFTGCTALREFNSVNLGNCTTLDTAFYGCRGLTQFNQVNVGKCTNITSAFSGTGALELRGLNFTGLSGNQFVDIFRGEQRGVFGGFNVTRSNVISIGSSSQPIGFGTTGGNTFGLQQFAAYCTSLRDVYFDSGVKITNLINSFTGCTSLGTFEVLDKNLSNCTNITGAFNGCVGLTSFTGFNLSSCTTIDTAFYGCSSLVNFDQVNLRNCATITGAFSGTGALRVGQVNLNGLSGNQFVDIFRGEQRGVFGGANVTRSNVISIGTSSQPIGFGTTGGNTFGLQQFAAYCTGLQEVYFDSGSKITNLIDAFTGCTSLSTFEVLDKNLSNCTNITGAFCNVTGPLELRGFNFTGLSGNQFFDVFRGQQGGVFGGANVGRSRVVSIGSSSQPIGFGTTGGNTFGLQQFAAFCTGLRQVYFDSGSKITTLNTAFNGCTGLTTFINQNPAVGFTTITDMTNAFLNCSLNADSIENILVSCNNGGKSSVVLNISGGTNAAYSTWSITAKNALTSLQGKSWTISYNT